MRAIARLDPDRRFWLTVAAGASLGRKYWRITFKQIEAEITRVGHHAKVRPAEHAQKAWP